MNDSGQSTKQRKRSIVFWLFVLLSVPLITLVVAYASGYRFDTHSKTVSVISLISIYTETEGASVLLNGEPQEQKTPFMQTVIPGEYTVAVSQDGYQPWEKHISVAEGKSAVFAKILLFAKTPTIQGATSTDTYEKLPHLRSLTNDEQTTYTNNGFAHADSLRILTGGPKVVVVDPKRNMTWLVASGDNVYTTIRIGDASTVAQWNADQSQLLFMNDSELWSYDVEKAQPILWRRQSTPLIDATWSVSSAYIFTSDENEISALEFDNRDTRQHWVLAPVSGAAELISTKKQLQFTANGKTFTDILEH